MRCQLLYAGACNESAHACGEMPLWACWLQASSSGYIHVVDRKKDMILCGGENVYCTEVSGRGGRRAGQAGGWMGEWARGRVAKCASDRSHARPRA